MKPIGRILVLFFSLLVLLSCVRERPGNGSAAQTQPQKREQQGSTAASPGHQAAAENLRPPTAIVIPSQQATTPADAGKGTGQASAPSVTEFTGREGTYLIQGSIDARTVPEIPSIGRLADGIAGSDRSRAQYSLVDRFLEAYAAGRVDTDVLLPGHADYLEMNLKLDLDRGDTFVSWFIGEIHQEGETTARTRVRLIGRSGRTTADVFVEKSGDRWYIGDIQADFTQLRGVPGGAQEARIEPGLPSWMTDTSQNGK